MKLIILFNISQTSTVSSITFMPDKGTMFNNILGNLQGVSKKTESVERDINILLLGETGVGKSTIINAFSNYIVYKNFKKAEKSGPLMLIPTTITDGLEEITVGQDTNEYEETGASATQHVKTYSFPIKKPKMKIRLIDTPGLADTRGIEKDKINCELILDYISTLKEVHAFCLVLKSNVARITAQFEYCLKQILMRLDKSAAQNIFFVITNTGNCGYGGGETLPCLETFVKGIREKPPHVEIPLRDGHNVFYFENECFKYLVAVSNKILKFTKKQKETCVLSWKKSSEQCWQLLEYIAGDNKDNCVAPHQVEKTISINEARKLIIQLSQPLADINQMIADNVDLLNKHESKLKRENQTLANLEANMYIPRMDLKITQISEPVTVCAAATCSELIKIEGTEKCHYRQICCNPCPLKEILREKIGDPRLSKCQAMDQRGYCKKCTCYFEKHMHVYYLTEYINVKIIDEGVKKDVLTQEKALVEVKKIIEEIKKTKEKLEKEHESIIQITAQFVHFLQNNAITPYDDSYKTYITYLIDCERSRGVKCNKVQIENMKNLLNRHEAAKAAFDRTLNEVDQTDVKFLARHVTAQTVLESIKTLFELEMNGAKIQDIYQKQRLCREGEYVKMNLGYEHPSVVTGIKEEEEIYIFFNF